jgi:hypothetical protein
MGKPLRLRTANVSVRIAALRALAIMVGCAFVVGACGTTPTPTALTQSPSPAAAIDGANATEVAIGSPSSASSSLSPPASGPVTTIDACSILTKDELTSAFGTDAVQTRPMPNTGWVAGQCAWNGPSSGFFIGIGTADSLADAGDPTVADAKSKLAQFKNQAAGGRATEVEGIGDGAIVTPAGIAAYKGGTYIQVTNLGLSNEQMIEVMKAAIRKL